LRYSWNTKRFDGSTVASLVDVVSRSVVLGVVGETDRTSDFKFARRVEGWRGDGGWGERKTLEQSDWMIILKCDKRSDSVTIWRRYKKDAVIRKRLS
jgi:hypothetical protein